MSRPEHLSALVRLKKSSVDFLIVGATAIDLFLPEMGSVYMTGDCDILVRPTFSNLQRTLRSLKSAGYAFFVNGEPLLPDALIIRRLLEYAITTRAEKKDSLPIDVLVEAKGFPFKTWWAKRTWFTAGGVSLPCAALEHVLESKKQAGRKKDRALLKLVAAASEAPPKSRPRPRSRRAF